MINNIHSLLVNDEVSKEKVMEDLFPSAFVRIGSIPPTNLKVEVLPSGFKSLDRNFVLKKSRAQLITVAAYTSHGKSAFLMQVAKNVSKLGPVFALSFEMSSDDITTRLIAGHAGVSATHIMEGKVNEATLVGASKSLATNHQLYLNTDPDNDIVQIQKICFEQSKRVGSPLLIVVDHIQLIGSSVDSELKTYMYGHIARKLASLAHYLKCPVLTATQMNRENERRGRGSKDPETGIGDYSPSLGDISDSSAIAHNSDVVLFLIRPEQYDGTRPGEADLYCVKNRGGTTFTTTMRWSGSQTSFYD